MHLAIFLGKYPITAQASFQFQWKVEIPPLENQYLSTFQISLEPRRQRGSNGIWNVEKYWISLRWFGLIPPFEIGIYNEGWAKMGVFPKIFHYCIRPLEHRNYTGENHEKVQRKGLSKWVIFSQIRICLTIGILDRINRKKVTVYLNNDRKQVL